MISNDKHLMSREEFLTYMFAEILNGNNSDAPDARTFEEQDADDDATDAAVQLTLFDVPARPGVIR